MESEKIVITSVVKNLFYQEAFRKIYESNETYKGKWNWNAFLFSGAWALKK